jgi:gliding motility-associated-like protein
VVVAVEQSPDPGSDGSAALCTGDGPLDLFDSLGGSPSAGGNWISPGGGAFSGLFDPTLDAPGVYTYSIGTTVCAAQQSTVQVSVATGPDAGQGNDAAFCSSGAPVALFTVLLGSPDTGGTWSAPGGGGSTGSFNPATDPAGAYTYTVIGNASCPDAVSVLNITISAAVTAGTSGTLTLCTTSAPQGLFASLGGAPQSGGAWSAPDGSVSSGTIDPATGASGLYTYTVQGPDPCPAASATVNVQLFTAADAGEDAAQSVCSDHDPVGLFSLLGGAPQPGGSWTGPDELPTTGIFTPGVSPVGAYTYEVVGQGPCASDISTVTMAVSQAADAGEDGVITLCTDADVFQLLPLLEGTPNAGGSWSYPDGSPCGGSVDPGADPSGAYTYTVVATAPCLVDEAVVVVNINPTPVPEILVMTDGGCSPVTAVFTNGYDGPGTCSWTFGNQSTSSECAPPPVVYELTGSYTVTLTMNAGNGCSATVTLENAVEVVQRPEAMFLVLPENLNTGAPQAFFQNGSVGAVSYLWQFDELGESEEAQPTFTFPSEVEGLYTVCLTAFASEACVDTMCAEVLVPAGAGLFVPNAFSPDGDGINDTFTPIVAGMGSENYEFLVFDRYGQQLFRSTMIGEGWNGQFGDGTLTPVGVYIWKVTGRDRFSGQRVDETGHVTLVR